jgi:hypothetical protein
VIASSSGWKLPRTMHDSRLPVAATSVTPAAARTASIGGGPVNWISTW